MSEDPIRKLEDKARKISNLFEIHEVLHWDQEVMMPEKGIEARKQQLSTISGLKHRIIVSDELSDLLELTNADELEKEERATYREIKREHERAKKVDQELIEKISSKSSETLESWKKAREQEDFDVVKEDLKELVELKREYAEQINPDEEPYKVLFRDYEPYLQFELMEENLERLKDRLTNLLEKIRDSNVSPENIFEKSVPEEKQVDLNREIVDKLGYDWERGRLDTSEHPFTAGNQFDVRITTRFDENDVSKSLMPTIHEFGHALYQMNLPEENYGLPTGQSREIGFHESQSTIWENHIARSRYFAKYLTENYDVFDREDQEELYRYVNRIKPDNPIRVEADELTYHLHIFLRLKLERQLINGDLEVGELQEKWRDIMENFMGIRPENPNKGVLQDIHWYQGSFGYFPTYSEGIIISAQIYNSMENDIDNIGEKISEGRFSEIREWLKENIHRKAKIRPTDNLIEEATGEELNVDHFLDYIEEKYEPLYGIE
ncbi:MAG: carboxypeptidase M32 [Candidatus Nanohaloarchaea archaeon]